jgi:hypothetical protein
VPDVSEEYCNFHDVLDYPTGSFNNRADILPHLGGLGVRIAEAYDRIVFVKGDLACYE